MTTKTKRVPSRKSSTRRKGKPTLRVLIVCHNHPSLYPGGAEGYALQVYRQMRDLPDVEPFFLARYGSTATRKAHPHVGTPFSAVGEDDHQYLMYTDAGRFDFFLLTQQDKELLTNHYRNFLMAIQPDIIHFQHTHFLGLDMLRVTRNTLPDVPIVYSLHEYLGICYRDGVMVRTMNNEPCMDSAPRRCSECFPTHTPQDFFMRKQFVQSHFLEVDQFLAPSNFLIDRYVDWGIERQRIRYHDQGLPRWDSPPNGEHRTYHNRFAFFGQVHPYKGIDILLRAMKLLAAGESESRTPSGLRPHLWVHGANLELQANDFQREVKDLVAALDSRVTWSGRYEEKDIPRLMSEIDWVVIPSRWWENSPRVIQEAFQYGRPVICSGMGALAEKVKHEVNGLHFRVADPASLAETLRQAATVPGLWEKLRHGIPTVRSIEDDAHALIDLYRELQGRKRNGR